jgi:hypothetical protein
MASATHYLVTNVPEQDIHFSPEELIRLLGSGPHRVIPECCSGAIVKVRRDDVVRIELTCVADRDLLQELCPDLLAKLEAQPEPGFRNTPTGKDHANLQRQRGP